MTPGRRSLSFRSLDEVMSEVEGLMAGHETVGAWSLGQICEHLALVMRRVVDLPASAPSDPSKWVPASKRDAVLDSGVLPEGIPGLPEIMPSRSIDAREGADLLRTAIAHYKASPTGPVIPHRVFGPLSREQWNRLQCVHCAHHLSFAVPTEV
jgi:hypothetical protein